MLPLLGQRIAANLAAIGVVHQPGNGVFNFVEGLALKRVYREDQMLGLGVQRAKVDIDHLVIAVAFAGQVVAAVADRSVARIQLREMDGIQHVLAAVENNAQRSDVVNTVNLVGRKIAMAVTCANVRILLNPHLQTQNLTDALMSCV